MCLCVYAYERVSMCVCVQISIDGFMQCVCIYWHGTKEAFTELRWKSRYRIDVCVECIRVCTCACAFWADPQWPMCVHGLEKAEIVAKIRRWVRNCLRKRFTFCACECTCTCTCALDWFPLMDVCVLIGTRRQWCWIFTRYCSKVLHWISR